MSKLKVWMSLSIVLYAYNLYAAGPITHIVLGERWLQREAPHYTQEQRKAFLLGTVFPDIRYLGTIQREKTHYTAVTLKAVREAHSPFHQGVLFHSFVDEFREQWIRQHRIQDALSDIPTKQRKTFLKIVEDQILYARFSWKNVQMFLNIISTEEKNYGIDEKTLNEWHAGLILYFTASPAVLLTQLGQLDQDVFNVKSATIREWAKKLPLYVQQKKMQDHVEDMIAAFEKV